jgi:hypothetical protein
VVGTLTVAAKILERYILDLLVFQQISLEKWGVVRAGNYSFSIEKETNIISLGTGFFVHHKIMSAGKRVEFVSYSITYKSIVLRRR